MKRAPERPAAGYDNGMSQTGRMIAGFVALLFAPFAYVALQPEPVERAKGCMDVLALGGVDGLAFDITPYLVMGLLVLVAIAFFVSCALVKPAE